MLILVGVTVSVVINSNLIGIAQDAGDRTKTAYNEESNMGEVTIGDKTYESIEDYVYGESPKLTYSTYGKHITISLEESYINYIAKKSMAEKESEYAVLGWGYESIEDVINNEFEGDRQAYEADLIEYVQEWDYTVQTYEEALNSELLSYEVFLDEYSATYSEKGNITVTAPDGTEYELSYADVDDQEFTYTVEEYGSYKFVAVNDIGRTKELTILTEQKMGTFSIEYEGEILGTFEFELGTTWEEFIGSEGIRVLNDDISIQVDDRYLNVDLVGDSTDYLLNYNSENSVNIRKWIEEWTYLVEEGFVEC